MPDKLILRMPPGKSFHFGGWSLHEGDVIDETIPQAVRDRIPQELLDEATEIAETEATAPAKE